MKNKMKYIVAAALPIAISLFGPGLASADLLNTNTSASAGVHVSDKNDNDVEAGARLNASATVKMEDGSERDDNEFDESASSTENEKGEEISSAHRSEMANIILKLKGMIGDDWRVDDDVSAVA